MPALALYLPPNCDPSRDPNCDLWLTSTEISLHLRMSYRFIFSHRKNSKVYSVIAEN